MSSFHMPCLLCRIINTTNHIHSNNSTFNIFSGKNAHFKCIWILIFAASQISAMSVEYLPCLTQSNTIYHLPQNGCVDREDVVNKYNFFTVFVCSPYAHRCRQSKRLLSLISCQHSLTMDLCAPVTAVHMVIAQEAFIFMTKEADL